MTKTKTKQATGAGISVALATALVLGGGMPASASTAAPRTASTATAPFASHVTPSTDALTSDGNSEARQTSVAIIPIIGAVILAGGAAYAMGEKAAERCYHAGLRKKQWQSIKWQARAAAIGMIGAVGGGIFITGFENKFYSMA